MDVMLLALLAISISAMVLFHAMHHVVKKSEMSGDKWHIRQFAFTDRPVSAPYCWRPLLPILARYLGFKVVSYSALIATVLLIYYWVGGGMRGLLCAMLYVGNTKLFNFNIRAPEYTEGLGHLLFMSSLWAMSMGSPLAWPLFLLSALCRETIAAALGAIALFWNPWLIAPLAAGAVASRFARRQDTENPHPLVEGTALETYSRLVRFKGQGVLHFAHIIQPLRGLAVVVPFMWDKVSDFSRLGIVGLIPIWLLALPASGQSRIVAYAFGLIVPFAAELPLEWLWGFVFLSWFWPVEIKVFDERGDTNFSYIR